MNPFERHRELIPFAIALYLASSVAQLQATQSSIRFERSDITVADVIAGLKRHMVEMARYEQDENSFASFAN